jgi:hypothetical protein
MPLSTEVVSNKPLTGPELVTIIEHDLRGLLEKDGMFNSHIAYGKVGYRIVVELALANPTYPKHTVVGGQPVALDPTDDVTKVELSRERVVKSPNVARIANNLPVKIQTRQEGKVVEKDLNYVGEVDLPPQDPPVDGKRGL